jgi:large subunit ribosomal protein L13
MFDYAISQREREDSFGIGMACIEHNYSPARFDSAEPFYYTPPPFLGTTLITRALMKTFSAKPHEVKREWLIVDAADQVLGRLASQIALRLRGKHKPEFTPHVDTGDYIVVVNASKVRVTGAKAESKTYHRHSGQPGQLHTTTFTEMRKKAPERIVEVAVKGMLPKGPLGSAMFRKLKVYAGTDHPHEAQQPRALKIK